MDSQPPDSRAPGPWLGLLLCLPLYLVPNYGYFHDAVMNASYVLYGDWLQRLHPHHVGYNALIWGLWQLIGSVGIAIHPLSIMATLGRVATLIALWQSWQIGRALGLRGWWATAGQVLIGISYGVWAHGTNGAVYMPALVCLLLTFLLGLRWIDAPPTTRDIRLSATALVVATLCHEMAILAVVPLGGWLVLRLRARQIAAGPSVRLAAAWVALPLIGAYTLAFIVAFGGLQGATLPGAARWFFRYGAWPHHWIWHRPDEGFTVWQQLWQALIESHGRLLMASTIGERFDVFTGSAVARSIQLSWPMDRILAVWLWLVPLLGLLTIVGAVLLARRGERERQAVHFALLFGGVFFLFTLAFEPENAHYRFNYWPMAVMLVMGAADALPGKYWQVASGALVSFVLVCLLSLNAAYGFLPRSQATCNPPLITILELTQLPAGPLAIPAYGDGYEEFHLARLMMPERAIYKLQWFTEEEYGVSIFGDRPLTERLVEGERALALTGGPLLISLGRTGGNVPELSAERPILRLSELQRGRSEPAELWLNYQALGVIKTHQLGDYRVLELIDPRAKLRAMSPVDAQILH